MPVQLQRLRALNAALSQLQNCNGLPADLSGLARLQLLMTEAEQQSDSSRSSNSSSNNSSSNTCSSIPGQLQQLLQRRFAGLCTQSLRASSQHQANSNQLLPWQQHLRRHCSISHHCTCGGQQQQLCCSAQGCSQPPGSSMHSADTGQQPQAETRNGPQYAACSSTQIPWWDVPLLKQAHSNSIRANTSTNWNTARGGSSFWNQHTARAQYSTSSCVGGSNTNAAGSRAPADSAHESSTSSSCGSSGSSTAARGSGVAAQTSSWLMRALPAAAIPYAQLMRLDKPIGSWLLAWPGLWSIGMVAAPGHLPDLWLPVLFGTGAVLMRGAGCTINDLWDRDIDKQVERTRSRPLAAGTVTPLAALVFLGAQLSAGLAILLQLNTYTQVLGVASLGLVATYPLMKRVTWWPQAFLGLAMNYGVLMGYSAAAGACDWAVVAPMYAAGVSWTLIYDTIYAHQDKRDDAMVGVKSTALLFDDRTKEWSTGFAVTQTLGMLLAGQAAGLGLPYFAGVAAGTAHIAWQIRSVDLQDGPDCMAKFVSNKWYGALIYAGIVMDRLIAV